MSTFEIFLSVVLLGVIIVLPIYIIYFQEIQNLKKKYKKLKKKLKKEKRKNKFEKKINNLDDLNKSDGKETK